MAKLTQKDLQAAMQPLRRAAERIARDGMFGNKLNADDLVIFRAGIEWHGYTIKAQLIRKSRVSCGVPAPYSLYQIHYGATHPEHGPICSGWEAGSFRGEFLRHVARRNL